MISNLINDSLKKCEVQQQGPNLLYHIQLLMWQPQKTLLDKVKGVKSDDKLVLTLTCHSSIKSFQNALNETYIRLTPDKEHRKVSGGKPPMIDQRKPKSLKDHLASAKFKCEPSLDNKSTLCCRFRCQIFPFIEETKIFQNNDKSETFDIRKKILNCRTNLVVYFIECRSCSKQYVGSTITPFRSCFNNYKSWARKVSKVYPKNVMCIKNNFIVTLTLRDTMGWSTGRLLSLIGLKSFRIKVQRQLLATQA